MKTNKSFTKRIKVTKNGKLKSRRPGQNHFNARQTGRQRLRRKRVQDMSLSGRIMRRFLPGHGGKGHATDSKPEEATNESNN